MLNTFLKFAKRKKTVNVANHNHRTFEKTTGHNWAWNTHIYTPHIAVRSGFPDKKMVTFLWNAPVHALSQTSFLIKT